MGTGRDYANKVMRDQVFDHSFGQCECRVSSHNHPAFDSRCSA
jgi:hypothetical protein